MRLARRAGIVTPHHQLIEVAGKAVLLSRRFDRSGAMRIPFLSAMAMIGARDGSEAAHPELVDALADMALRERQTRRHYTGVSFSTC